MTVTPLPTDGPVSGHSYLPILPPPPPLTPGAKDRPPAAQPATGPPSRSGSDRACSGQDSRWDGRLDRAGPAATGLGGRAGPAHLEGDGRFFKRGRQRVLLPSNLRRQFGAIRQAE